MTARLPAPVEVGDPGRIEETRLSNGIHVLTERMPGVRSAAVGVWVRQGAAHEARGEMGASHLLEHLVFKGTRKRSAREIATALEGLGGSLDAYTGREQTSYQARVLHEHVGEALEVLSDLILSPALREEDLERERQVVLEEIAMVEDTPEDVVFELHGERLWEGHPYGRSILGTRETVGSLSTGTLRALHRDRYLRPDLVVAAAGHVGHDAVVGQVRDLLGHLNGNGGRPGVPEPSARRGGQEAVSRETAQTHVVFGTDAPPHSDPRRFGLVLLSAAFGGGMSSRLFQKVREELALAYTVYAFQSFHGLAGTCGVYVGTRPEWANRIVEVIREEYRVLAEGGLDREELERTKEQVKGQVMLSLESTGSRLYRLAAFALHEEPFLGLDELLAKVDAVTEDDIRRVASRYVDPRGHLELRLGPSGDDPPT